MPRIPEEDDVQGWGTTRALPGTVGEDIGSTACRLAEDVSRVVRRPSKEEEEQGNVVDGETFAEVGLPTDVCTTEFGCAEADVIMFALGELGERRTPRGVDEADMTSIEVDQWSRGKFG